MATLNSINGLQREFIRQLRDGEMSSAAFKARWRENPKGMARWFRSNTFWAHVRRALKERGRKRRLVNNLTAEEAGEKMATMIEAGNCPAEVVSACTEAQGIALAEEKFDGMRK